MMIIRILQTLSLFCICLAVSASAARGEVNEQDRQLYQRWSVAMDQRLPSWDSHKTKWKEDIGWHAAPMLRGLVGGYAWSRDPKWLDALTDQIDVLMSRLQSEPIPGSSSEKSFPGWGHSITGEALVLEPIFEFIALARSDADMPQKFKDKAAGYLKTFDPIMVTKWFEAGCWADTHLDGGTFIEGISLPHNKNAHLGAMLLAAAHATESAERRVLYLEKANRLARQWRNNLKLAGDCYIWHYWDAAGPWDFDEQGKSRHWTSLEHRGYAVSNVHFMAAAYDHGLVFDRRDVEMVCRTFLTKIWNGDDENPKYRALGWFNADYAASTVLPGLAPYHPKIMELWGKDVERTAEGWGGLTGVPAYLLVRKQDSGFQRQNAAMGQLLKEALDSRPQQAKADAQTDPIVR